jgi:hypothetical protein
VILFVYFAIADTDTSSFRSHYYSVPFFSDLGVFCSSCRPFCECSAAGAESYKSASFETSKESRLVLMILIEGNCHRSRGQLLSPPCHQSYGLVTGVPSVPGIAV